jgi:hypothetical protein
MVPASDFTMTGVCCESMLEGSWSIGSGSCTYAFFSARDAVAGDGCETEGSILVETAQDVDEEEEGTPAEEAAVGRD